MTIQDRITADQQAVAEAQAALDKANAQLASDQAALANVQPELDLITQLEEKLSGNADALNLLEQVKAIVNA